MNQMSQMSIEELRNFLKDDIRSVVNFDHTDQALGLAMPPVQKAILEADTLLPLPEWRGQVQARASFEEVLLDRKSIRKFAEEAPSAQELSYLLYMTQGVRRDTPGRVLRTVPSAGNRHSTETYLVFTRPINDKEGQLAFEPGLYRYAPIQHALLYLGTRDNLMQEVNQAALDQTFAGNAPVIFFWAALPYRTEWRYAESAHKVMAIDLGHICQNLYLAATAIGCGTCAIAAYRQEVANALFSLDGKDEFIVYLAPVGKLR